MKHLLIFLSLGWAMPLLAAATPQTESAVTTDPARLAVADRVVRQLLPDGTYRKLMGGTMNKMMSSMMDQMTALPVQHFLAMAGLPKDKADGLGPGTIKEIMAIVDPAFDQRTRISMNVMMTEMGELMTGMEPDIRAGMAEAYAHRFSLAELGEIDRFFATPTGSAYAAASMQLAADPAVMDRMQTLMPRILDSMPAIMAKVEQATAGLPPRTDPRQMSDSDRAKLAALLGLDPKAMK